MTDQYPKLQYPKLHFIGIDRSRGPDKGLATVVIDVTGLIDPSATIDAACTGIAERGAQDIRWGQSNHPDLQGGVRDPCAFFHLPAARVARNDCEAAFAVGGGSNAHILIEEVCEAIEAARDPVHLRAELVQVMAVAMKWVEQIDRRRGFSGAHGDAIAGDELRQCQAIRADASAGHPPPAAFAEQLQEFRRMGGRVDDRGETVACVEAAALAEISKEPQP